jgi:hypothetical protein
MGVAQMDLRFGLAGATFLARRTTSGGGEDGSEAAAADAGSCGSFSGLFSMKCLSLHSAPVGQKPFRKSAT